MSSFTNVKILEANRLASEEAKSGNNTNNALWTNKLGSGVRVSIGDQIQVQSSFIGERGAGASVIEFDGETINNDATYTISYLNASEEHTFHDYRFTAGCSVRENSIITETIQLKDNQASMVVSFYKNANGENYTQLPRKFAVKTSQLANVTLDNGIWYDQEGSVNNGSGADYGPAGGMPHNQVPYFARGDLSFYYCIADYYYFTSEINQTGYSSDAPSQYAFWKIRNDNSKFKIYVAETQYFNGSDHTISDEVTDAPASYYTIEPSFRTWLPYTSKIDVEVTKGFNSPENVAEELTKEFMKTGIQQTFDYPFNKSANYSPSAAITTYLDSPSYKTFDCYNYLDWQSDSFDIYNSSATTGAPVQAVVDYINVTNTIGVKRPELWDAGITCAENLTDGTGAKFRSAFAGAPKLLDDFEDTDEYIVTTIKWTDANVLLLKNLFDAQSYYPELFDNKHNPYGNQSTGNISTTVLNSRFLHINQLATGFNSNTIFGTDDITASGTATNMNTWTKNHITLPLFFKFDNNASQTATDGVSAGSYGCMFKEVISHTLGYIKFYVGSLDNNEYQPPPNYIKYNDGSTVGTEIAEGTMIGYDTHFTAYGTCCIALTDGWTRSGVNLSYELPLWRNGINSTGTAVSDPQTPNPYIRKLYLGANEPLISYNASSSRFDISSLHTTEYIGNVDWAGATSASETVTEINPDAANKVYKINKRNNCNNWTNALQPYSQNSVIGASNPGPALYDISLMNYNMNPYSIFDSQSGIIIEDFGFDNTNWEDGLWGIIGFTYNQFNGSITSDNNFNRRITESNIKNLPYAITNADVNAGKCINFRVNGWGIPMYNAQLPVSFLWNGSGFSTTSTQDGTRYGMPIENHPPITELQESIQLVATNLPRKMLKPYYCIRSDIVDDTHYLGGADSGGDLPVVAVINKINGYGDFYFGEISDLIFTATRSRMITSITTSIHYPNQKFAEVNKDSAIIYKIIHQQPAVANIVQEILQEGKQKKK
jgi:hypothetical protein